MKPLAVAGALALLAAPPTPARVDIDFATAAKGPASTFASVPFVTTARARRIAHLRLEGRNHVLLVAPTADGGFCTSLSGPHGGTGCTLPGPLLRRQDVLDPRTSGDAGGPILFDGYFTVANAARLRVTFEDGRTDTIPFAWVGRPIRAGFFLYALTGHRRPGHRPTALTLFGAHGAQLYRQRLPG